MLQVVVPIIYIHVQYFLLGDLEGEWIFSCFTLLPEKPHFHIQGDEEIVTAGHMVLYRPKEPQKYEYYGNEQTEVYWVHFTGSDVTNILYSYGLTKDKKIFYCGSDLEYKNHFRAMIQELQMCKEYFPEMLEMHLRQILIKLHRYFNSVSKADNNQIAQDIDDAMIYFSEHYNENICIECYAKEHHMSTSWFIRNFKQYTGSTPMQYILSKRIYNATALLQNEHYNITEIATIVGYDNPLYFSRIFKKIQGISPKEYRKNIMQKHPE